MSEVFCSEDIGFEKIEENFYRIYFYNLEGRRVRYQFPEIPTKVRS